jgi:hypothetical protein
MQVLHGTATGGGSSSQRYKPSHSWLPDACALLWVLIAGLVSLVPALVHGTHLGPFDLLAQFGLTQRPGVVAHNGYVGDQINAIMPWTTLAAMQVHHGQLPLWNPYNGLGSPLAFNWQSATFGLPALIGYLGPVQYAYTVGIVVTIVVAGTGAYVFGRTLGLSPLASAMAGTVFELSGPMVMWLGWPHAAVASWSGWIFTAALRVIRGKRRVRNVVFFAVVLAFACYAGQPEILVVLLFSLAIFLAITLVVMAWKKRSCKTAVVDLGIAGFAGFALAAPLLLPGLQLYRQSVHSATRGVSSLPLHYIVYLALQGFDGLPLAGSKMFGPLGPFYFGGYVGVIALVLAALAVVMRRRSTEVIAIAGVALVCFLLVFAGAIPHLVGIVTEVPILGANISRLLLPLAFALAMLAGVGFDSLVTSQGRRVWKATGAGFAAIGAGLFLLFLATTWTFSGHITFEDRLRVRSFIWPSIDVVVGLIVVATYLVWTRSVPRERRSGTDSAGRTSNGDAASSALGRVVRTSPAKRFGPAKWAGLVMLAAESVFLITAGAPLWSSSSTFFTPTHAITRLERYVGESTVGTGAPTLLCFGLGIDANVNAMYGVHELALYDPLEPKDDFSSFKKITGQSAGFPLENEYCPSLTSAKLARRYGVVYILDPPTTPIPNGTQFVARIGGEDLYRVPDSSAATLTALAAGGALPPDTAQGRTVRVDHPSPSSWKLVTDSAQAEVLRLHLSNVPGWHASIDGRPLALSTFSGTMMQARVPAGRHLIELTYWPDTLSVGLVLATASAIGLAGALLVSERRRRVRGRTTSACGPSTNHLSP